MKQPVPVNDNPFDESPPVTNIADTPGFLAISIVIFEILTLLFNVAYIAAPLEADVAEKLESLISVSTSVKIPPPYSDATQFQNQHESTYNCWML